MARRRRAGGHDPRKRMRGRLRAFLEMLAEHPNESQTLLVEIIGAGTARRRSAATRSSPRFAQAIDAENADAARKGSMRALRLAR